MPLLLVHGDPEAAASLTGHPSHSGDSDRPASLPNRGPATRARPAPTTAPGPAAGSVTPTPTGPGSPVPSPDEAVAREVPVRQVVVTTTTTSPPPPTTTSPSPGRGGVGATSSPVHFGQVTFYDHPAGTCASPWLPFGTLVVVTNPDNGSSVNCVVDDREADTDRSIDLATPTFAELAPLAQGVIDARLQW